MIKYHCKYPKNNLLKAIATGGGYYPRAFRRKSGDYVIPFAVRPSVRLPFDRPLSPPRLLKLES